MRFATILAAVLAALPAAAFAQGSDHPLGLDPYKPSDAAILRTHGAVLASQASPEELAALDPYKPSHAALLRMGGALPACAFGWTVPYGPCARAVIADRRAYPDERAHVPRSPEAAAQDRPAEGPTSIASVRRPESNDGIWIAFGDARWLLAGRAEAYVPTAFETIGEVGGRPVYRRRDAGDGRIYVHTSPGLVAPFRRRS